MYDDLLTIYRRDLAKEHQGKLTREEQRDAARRGDHEVLIASLLPLVLFHVNNFVDTCAFEVDDDVRSDLLQAGNLALMNAVKRWNPDAEKAPPLSIWASFDIKRDIKREFTRQSQLTTNVYTDSVIALTPAGDGLRWGSNGEAHEDVDWELPEQLQSPSDVVEEASVAEAKERLGGLLACLTETQRRVLELVDLRGLSGSEAAEVLGVSQQTVSKTRILALKVLSEVVDSEGVRQQ